MSEDTGFFNFKKTGVAEIDNILKEVDNAGEKCRTKDWADDTEGLSFIDLIQDAANKAVEIYKRRPVSKLKINDVQIYDNCRIWDIEWVAEEVGPVGSIIKWDNDNQAVFQARSTERLTLSDLEQISSKIKEVS